MMSASIRWSPKGSSGRRTDLGERLENTRTEGPMKKLVLATVVALGMLLGFDGPAGAQWAAPMGMGWGNPYQAPMDMSWAIQSQGMLQQYGDWAAMNAANTYLNYMNQIRNTATPGRRCRRV
jgi:hypothetical protein